MPASGRREPAGNAATPRDAADWSGDSEAKFAK
jgi:hypothetical protein